MIQKLKNKVGSRKGFTLAELLIVVAIIAVLVAIAVPVFSAQLNRAKIATDEANFRAARAAAAAAFLDTQAGGSSVDVNGKYFTTDGEWQSWPASGSTKDFVRAQATVSAGNSTGTNPEHKDNDVLVAKVTSDGVTVEWATK